MRIFKCSTVLLILMTLFSCNGKNKEKTAYLAGKTYSNQKTLSQIKFISSNRMIFEWPDQNKFGCLEGMCSMRLRYSLLENGEIDFMLTSTQIVYCPYKKIVLSQSRKKIIAISARDETQIFNLLRDN